MSLKKFSELKTMFKSYYSRFTCEQETENELVLSHKDHTVGSVKIDYLKEMTEKAVKNTNKNITVFKLKTTYVTVFFFLYNDTDQAISIDYKRGKYSMGYSMFSKNGVDQGIGEPINATGEEKKEIDLFEELAKEDKEFRLLNLSGMLQK